MGLGKFREVQLADIIANPNKFGAPTYEQFCRNPNRWRLPSDSVLQSASAGSRVFNNVKKQRYEVLRPTGAVTKCQTLEEVERVCLSEGIAIEELEMRNELIDVGAGKVEILVQFRRKPKVGG